MSASAKGAWFGGWFIVMPREHVDAGSGRASGAGKKSKSAVRGAKKGKLRPGEKQQLKQARVEAKRAARASSHHGLDLESINQQLLEFVEGTQDMLVSPGSPTLRPFIRLFVMKAQGWGLISSLILGQDVLGFMPQNGAQSNSLAQTINSLGVHSAHMISQCTRPAGPGQL